MYAHRHIYMYIYISQHVDQKTKQKTGASNEGPGFLMKT